VIKPKMVLSQKFSIILWRSFPLFWDVAESTIIISYSSFSFGRISAVEKYLSILSGCSHPFNINLNPSKSIVEGLIIAMLRSLFNFPVLVRAE